jgi:peptidoglycan/xylan/chitin deacetylase (PgdA/CDA1 family)
VSCVPARFYYCGPRRLGRTRVPLQGESVIVVRKTTVGAWLNFHHLVSEGGGAKRLLGFVGVLLLILLAHFVRVDAGAKCGGNPHALGTARTVIVDPGELPLLGTLGWQQTLPLRDHEVALTFDDGPSPSTTGKVLDSLATECVAATFFVLGERVVKAPALVRRAALEGHTIGTHTQTHPALPELPLADAEAEIRTGIATAAAALSPDMPAPFFRAPYLKISPEVADFVVSEKLSFWSADVETKDWMADSSDTVIRWTFNKLEPLKKGIVLLHDVKPYTAEALPRLLKELKARGYKAVRVVPATHAVTAPTSNGLSR